MTTQQRDDLSAEKGYQATTEKEIDSNIVDATQERPDEFDVAGTWLAHVAQRPDADALLADWTPEEEKTILRKATWVIIPIITICTV